MDANRDGRTAGRSDEGAGDEGSSDEGSTERRGEADGGRRLLLDVMLGKLATYLRMCGYDTAYALDREVEDDDRILAIADREDRLLVTCDRGLARRAGSLGVDAVLLEQRDVVDQLRELAATGVDVSLPEEPERCSRCNGLVEVVQRPADAETDSEAERKSDTGTGHRTDARPEYVPTNYSRVWRCEECGRWFWKGSHWKDVAERLKTVSTIEEDAADRDYSR